MGCKSVVEMPSRIINSKNFTCRKCRHTTTTRHHLAMATSQAGLCVSCYYSGYRIYIDWIQQFAYVTLVARAEDLRDPERPRGAHNLMVDEHHV